MLNLISREAINTCHVNSCNLVACYYTKVDITSKHIGHIFLKSEIAWNI